MANEILELEQFEAKSFMGISASHPILIDFTGKKKNQNIVEFFGNQGLCKTSTICGILYAMGATFNIDKKKLLNTTDEAIDVNLKFKYEEESYQVVAKTGRIELKKLNEDTGKWSAVDSPVAMLRKIFGPVGLSPFSVKELKGKDQIKYFQDMFGSGEDASKKMKNLEAEIEKIFSDRRDVNREVKALEGALNAEPLFQNYEKSLERFEKPISAEKEKKKYDELSEKKTAYEKYENTVSIAAADVRDKTNKIAELEKQLSQLKVERDKMQESVTKGNKWLEDNKEVLKEFETANNEWLNLSKTLSEYETWKAVLKKEKEFNEKQEQAITLTGELDKKREALLKLTKSCLPKVEGLTIKVAAGLDKTDQPEGVFFGEQAIHELSESEYIDMWCQIWDAAGTNHVFVENISSLGSDAVATLNSIAKNGGTVFATRMDRKVKEIGISFQSKITE